MFELKKKAENVLNEQFCGFIGRKKWIEARSTNVYKMHWLKKDYEVEEI